MFDQGYYGYPNLNSSQPNPFTWGILNLFIFFMIIFSETAQNKILFSLQNQNPFIEFPKYSSPSSTMVPKPSQPVDKVKSSSILDRDGFMLSAINYDMINCN